jgi:F-type H+-transporting ATPase subunit delta
MADEQAAKRYAQAALELGIENGDIETWRQDLEDLATVLSESDAANYFADTRVPIEDRLKSAERVLDVSPMSLNLARVLVSRGRSRIARQVANAFSRLADAHHGIEHAKVITAVELPGDRLRAIEARLSQSLGKSVRATSVVDPSIIGGILIRVGDSLVDGSVRTRLKRLRLELEGVR